MYNNYYNDLQLNLQINSLKQTKPLFNIFIQKNKKTIFIEKTIRKNKN